VQTAYPTGKCQREKLAALLQQELRCRTVANADLELRSSGMRRCNIPLHLTSGSGFATGMGLDCDTPTILYSVTFMHRSKFYFMTLYSYNVGPVAQSV
jgi:hypothetical protein